MRLSPRVSSRTAAWVRSASVKPKATRRATAASGLSAPGGGRERLEQRAEVDPLVDRPHRELVAAQVAPEALGGVAVPACRGSPAPGPGGRPRPGRPARCGPAARRRAGGGARPCAGSGRRRPAVRRPRGRRSRPRPSRRSATSVFGERRSASAWPCTSWSSWTVNSMSRMPPGPSLISRSSSPCWDTSSSARCFIVAKRARRSSALNGWLHNHRWAVSAKRTPSSRSPATGARLEQGLELPRLGPPVPVGLVALDRAHQSPVAALGPQVGVDPEAVAGDVHDLAGLGLELVGGAVARRRSGRRRSSS